MAIVHGNKSTSKDVKKKPAPPSLTNPCGGK